MSAAVVPMPNPARRNGLHVLPRVKACASGRADHRKPGQPRPPHHLRLVQASAQPTWQAPKAIRAMQPEIAFYRKYTEGMLRRYQTMSFEKGRVPALLGRELFRGHVSNYQVNAFDDVVIFVHDMDRCLTSLDTGSQYLLQKITLEGYTQQETAALAGVSLRTVVRRYGQALDKLTRLLLDREILRPVLDYDDAEA